MMKQSVSFFVVPLFPRVLSIRCFGMEWTMCHLFSVIGGCACAAAYGSQPLCLCSCWALLSANRFRFALPLAEQKMSQTPRQGRTWERQDTKNRLQRWVRELAIGAWRGLLQHWLKFKQHRLRFIAIDRFVRFRYGKNLTIIFRIFPFFRFRLFFIPFLNGTDHSTILKSSKTGRIVWNNVVFSKGIKIINIK